MSKFPSHKISVPDHTYALVVELNSHSQASKSSATSFQKSRGYNNSKGGLNLERDVKKQGTYCHIVHAYSIVTLVGTTAHPYSYPISQISNCADIVKSFKKCSHQTSN